MDVVQIQNLVRHHIADLLNAEKRLMDVPNGREIGVRLEDTHEFPERTLAALCRWLGIDFSRTMMQPTEYGLSVETPSSSGVILSSFTTEHLQNQHEDILTSADFILMENLFDKNYDAWGYDFLSQRIAPK